MGNFINAELPGTAATDGADRPRPFYLATSPDLFGPIIVPGTPLSYWAGWRGQNPMRYGGGLLGGSWLAALASDLGAGRFDGAALVGNFAGNVQFLQREPLSVLAFNQHKDYAQRNMVYVRAELRAMQLIYAPREIVVADLTAAV